MKKDKEHFPIPITLAAIFISAAFLTAHGIASEEQPPNTKPDNGVILHTQRKSIDIDMPIYITADENDSIVLAYQKEQKRLAKKQNVRRMQRRTDKHVKK